MYKVEWMNGGRGLAANCRRGKASVTSRGRQVVVPTDRQTKDVLLINAVLPLNYSSKMQVWSKSQAYNFTTSSPSHNWISEGWEPCCSRRFIATLQWLWATTQWVKESRSVRSQGTSYKLDMGTQAFSNALLSTIPFGMAGRARAVIRTWFCGHLWYKSLPVPDSSHLEAFCSFSDNKYKSHLCLQYENTVTWSRLTRLIIKHTLIKVSPLS